MPIHCYFIDYSTTTTITYNSFYLPLLHEMINYKTNYHFSFFTVLNTILTPLSCYKPQTLTLINYS